MILSRRRVLLGGSTSLALASAGLRAGAVVVPHSTWQAEGLQPFITLAHQAQFASLVALSDDGGQDWNVASSTWIGNFGGVGWLLTAAHVFQGDETADHYLYRTRSGQIRHGTAIIKHPFNGHQDYRSGFDAALVRLDRPITDSGPQPSLFSHELEGGEEIVFVGFGARGTGAHGEDEDLDRPADNKTAAENVVDEVMDPVDPLPGDDEDAGNWIRITLHRHEDGGGRLDGLLGGGDSGGSAWLQDGDGRWGIVGINVAGTGDTTYGTHSFFASISGLRPWLDRVRPGLRFID